MTEAAANEGVAPIYQTDAFARRLNRRYAAERRFRLYGVLAIGVALAMLVVLLGSIVTKGYTAFLQNEVTLEVHFDPQEIDPSGQRDARAISGANYQLLAREALRARFPEVDSRAERRDLDNLLSIGAGYELRSMVMDNPDLIGTRQTVSLPVSDDIDQFLKGNISRESAGQGRISERQVAWTDRLEEDGAVSSGFNWRLLTNGDSREPELAGIYAATIGSILTLAVTLVLSVPIGVGAAVYLEEFAPKNRWTDLIEVNINNLAAVPSIVFGLLGLAVFLGFFGMPRSAPVVGGIVLALMSLPIVIITTRAALKAVPPSIREAALGIGASPLQVVTHHVLPLAMPGIMTGTIISMAHALGETAPLLMIGMVAFIVDTPGSFTDAASVLPVTIFMWADSPERAFVERTSAAIMILLGFLITMNALAIILRKRFERRW